MPEQSKGQRTDIKENQLQQNFAEVKGKQTLEIAAERAGFQNKETYRQAKKVVTEGTPELVQAVETGHVASVAEAYFYNFGFTHAVSI